MGIDYEEDQSTAVIAYALNNATPYLLNATAYDPVANTFTPITVPSMNGSNGSIAEKIFSVKVSAARDIGVNDVWIAGETSVGNLKYVRFNGTTNTFKTNPATGQTVTTAAQYLTWLDQRDLAYDINDGLMAYTRNDSFLPYNTNTSPGSNGFIFTTGSIPFSPVDTTGVARYIRIVASPVEQGVKIMAVQDNNGQITTQKWNGSVWSQLTPFPLNANDTIDPTTWRTIYRGFDIAFERATGNALIVYQTGATQPSYRTLAKGQTAWSLETEMTDWDTPSAATYPVWLRLEANPDVNSQEIIAVGIDTSSNTVADVWEGGPSWLANSDTVLTTQSGASIYEQSFDLAYTWDDVNPKAVVAFGDTSRTNQWGFAVWYSTSAISANGAAWGPMRNGPFALTGGTPLWVKLVTNRGNNNADALGLGISDTSNGLSLSVWIDTGTIFATSANQLRQTATATLPTESATTGSATQRPFDLAWEKSGNDLVAEYALTGNAQPRHFDYTNDWTAAAVLDPKRHK